MTSIAPASSIAPTGPAPTDNGLAVSVFWVRPPDEDRAIDMPGFRDPSAGPRPLVVYGSVTNAGVAAVVRPFVTATWVDAGRPVASYTADVITAGATTPATSLLAGESGDVIIVVDDPAVALRLGSLVPQLRAAGR